MQEFVINYTDVYSPVIDFTLVLICIVICLNFDWHARHIDGKKAFLNGYVDAEIVVTHPINLPKGMNQNDVNLLRKALYRLKQSPLLWYRKLIAALNQLGFSLLAGNEAVLGKMEDGKTLSTLIHVYVDNLIFMSRNEHSLHTTIKDFLHVFIEEDLGPLEWYLGV